MLIDHKTANLETEALAYKKYHGSPLRKTVQKNNPIRSTTNTIKHGSLSKSIKSATMMFPFENTNDLRMASKTLTFHLLQAKQIRDGKQK